MERKILIVDDERSIVDILKYNLEKDGKVACSVNSRCVKKRIGNRCGDESPQNNDIVSTNQSGQK